MSREGFVERLKLAADHGQLEARLEGPESEPRATAVVGHPHPQHGGTMDSKPVYYLAKALRSLNLATLRFNFRGVGSSTGEYDGGIGEMDDYNRAVELLQDRYPDKPILATGFSFGSSIAIRVAHRGSEICGIVGLGVPIDCVRKPLPNLGSKPILVIQARQDRFGDPGAVADWLAKQDKGTLDVLEGTNHFFEDALDRMQEIVMNYYSVGAGQEILRAAPGGRGIP